MISYNFHITPYDLFFLGAIFIGLTFTLQLWFAKRINRTANRFLALALLTIVLRMAWLLGMDMKLGAYYPHWSWLSLQFSLALGPLLYFYVLKITRPESKFKSKDLLHFNPLLLEISAYVFETGESIKTGAPAYDTLMYERLNPVVQLLAFISVIYYLYRCYKLIENFYRQLKFNGGDRYRRQLHWLKNLLTGFGLLWLLWIAFTAVDYYYYHLGINAYYPLYLLLAVMIICMAVVAFFRPEPVAGADITVLKPLAPAALKQKGIWLKRVVKENGYYLDPELSLPALAEKLKMPVHELSRIINVALKKTSMISLMNIA